MAIAIISVYVKKILTACFFVLPIRFELKKHTNWKGKSLVLAQIFTKQVAMMLATYDCINEINFVAPAVCV